MKRDCFFLQRPALRYLAFSHLHQTCLTGLRRKFTSSENLAILYRRGVKLHIISKCFVPLSLCDEILQEFLIIITPFNKHTYKCKFTFIKYSKYSLYFEKKKKKRDCNVNAAIVYVHVDHLQLGLWVQVLHPFLSVPAPTHTHTRRKTRKRASVSAGDGPTGVTGRTLFLQLRRDSLG